MNTLVSFSVFFNATRKAAVALDHVADFGRPVLLPKQHQVSLPVSELLAMRNDVRAKQDAELRCKSRWRALAQPVAPAALAATGQVAPQLRSATLLGIDVLIDCLLADSMRGALIPHTPGDLLRRPARLQTALGLVAEAGITHRHALPDSSSVRIALCHHAPVTAELRDFTVMEMIAMKLAEDRRAVPADSSRHLVRAQLHLPPALDLAALRKGKVRKPNLHSMILSWLNPLMSTESRISG
ncbi:MAG: hypothetical protein VYB46_12250 [Pseudomonadota bacterium]|nr:hypothetical protein [Pseudomonadota bacterium]